MASGCVKWRQPAGKGTPAVPWTLRPYQAEAVRAVCDRLRKEHRAYLVLPTGCGKTLCLADVIRRRVGQHVLVLAHRKNLVAQAARTLERYLQEDVGIEQGPNRADPSRQRVVVGTVQTVSRRLEDFQREHFDLVVVDEAHHHAAESYRKVERYFGDADLLGVSATPTPQTVRILGEPAYCLDVRDAIAGGWLVPIRPLRVRLSALNLAPLKTVAGDFTRKELDSVMRKHRVLYETAAAIERVCKGRKTIVYTATVHQAHMLAGILNEHAGGAVAEAMDGEMEEDERMPIMRRFVDGERDILVNCALFTEGWDCPPVNAVVVARPTKSRILFQQMVGRGTRPLPGVVDGVPSEAMRHLAIAESDKPDLLVVELVGNMGKHILATTAEMLADMEVAERAAQGDPLAQQAIENAANLGMLATSDLYGDEEDREEKEPTDLERFIAEEYERLKKREAEAARLIRIRNAALEALNEEPLEPLATEKQVAFLARFGHDARGWTRRKAGFYIGNLMKRFRRK